MPEMTSGSIIKHNEDGSTEEQFLMTHDPNELEEIKANKELAEMVFTPEFIPYYPEIAKNFGLTSIEALAYGFIRFYLGSGKSRRFYFSNTQLAEILDSTEGNIKHVMSKLQKCGLIKATRRIKSGGGTMRFTTLISNPQLPPFVSPSLPASLPAAHLHIKDNKIKDNKIKENIVAAPLSNFDMQEKTIKMQESQDVRVQIILAYWVFKGMVFDNEYQYRSAIKRELRPADSLRGYPLNRIQSTMAWLQKNVDFKWTLETVLKYIDDPIIKPQEVKTYG